MPDIARPTPGVDPSMSSKQVAVILKRFESPDEVRVLQKGRFELVHIGGMTIGRAVYEPGWKWSEHVGPGVGATRCHVEHIGLVLSGSNSRLRRWNSLRAKSRRSFLHPADSSRQLGDW